MIAASMVVAVELAIERMCDFHLYEQGDMKCMHLTYVCVKLAIHVFAGK